MTTVFHDRVVQGLTCDRCGRWEVGIGGVLSPETWVAEDGADAHLCPGCVISVPSWSHLEVEALRSRAKRALSRSMELHEQFHAVQAQAAQALRRAARSPAMTLALPPTAASVGIARRLVAAFAQDVNGIGADVALLTTELVTNAILHAGLPATGELTVHVSRAGEGLRVSVIDHGPGIATVPSRPDPDCPHGRGLEIVERLARGWGSAPGTVWFRV
jgi:anti-sigma regulatory factor (Ser/Thr protein kinase)